MFEKKDEVKAELRDVRVLKFGVDEVGTHITAEGATVPDEVFVYDHNASAGRTVGRAVLRVKEDGIYADVMLSHGSVDGRVASVILTAGAYEKTETGRKITQYKIRGVSLTKVPVPVTKETNEDSNQEQA